jgi:hypothetical protein
MGRISYRVVSAAVAAVAAAVVMYWHPVVQAPGGTVAGAQTAPAPASVAELLQRIRVVDHVGLVPGYQRSCKKNQGCVFGEAWHDPLDHSGCDVRNRLLAKSLQNIAFKPGTRDCKVIAGQLNPDPYTGAVVDLHQVVIDHIYPLHAAWDAGASTWDGQRRRIFANDMTEVIAVSSTQNGWKGDATLAGWLPPVAKCDVSSRFGCHVPVSDVICMSLRT